MDQTTGTIERIDYETYRYGRSNQRFRGPQPDLKKPYIAFVGGSETYGKFVPDPFPAILERRLSTTCANWGTPGAGPVFFLADPVVLEACSCARICVITVMGAVGMTNRLYTVFKRRNARVRSVSETLRALYPEMELGDFRFAHNMLRKMHAENPNNFKVIEIELRQAWVARMRELLESIETTRVLVWMSARAPEEDPGATDRHGFVTSPAFVNRQMLEDVAPMADVLVEYVPAPGIAEMANDGRVFEHQEADAAMRHPGATMHAQVADLLEAPLRDMLTIKPIL